MNQLKTLYREQTTVFNLPETIDEMDERSFRLLVKLSRANVLGQKFRSEIFMEMLKMANFQHISLLKKEYNFDEISKKFTDFLLQNNDSPLLNCLIPTLFKNWKKLHGFGLLFSNLNFRQFRKAQCHAYEYAQTEDESELNLMIAWLYIPKKSLLFTDKRFTEASAIKRAKRISKLDIDTRFAIYTNFNQVRDSLKFKYPLTLLKSDEKQKFFGNNQEEIDLEENFEDMIFTRSGGDITKDELVDLSPCLDIFAHFESEARDYKRQKEALDNAPK